MQWPEFSVKLPAVGNVAINAAFFKKFDYSSATVLYSLFFCQYYYYCSLLDLFIQIKVFWLTDSYIFYFIFFHCQVRLIASVPGYHMGPNLKKWGHMKMRTVLNEHIFDKEFHKSPLVYQVCLSFHISSIYISTMQSYVNLEICYCTSMFHIVGTVPLVFLRDSGFLFCLGGCFTHVK